MMQRLTLLTSLVIISVQIAFGQSTQFISTFGDKIIEGRDDQISIQFQYGVSSFDVTTSVVSTGTIQSVNSMAVIASGTNTSASAQIQSIDTAVYKPGHETHAFFTAFFPNGSASNSTQWIGLFDTNDGFAIGYNNTTFSVLLRRGSVDTTIAQSSFNGDKLDGTGPSGFVLNPANINIFRIAFGWLGSAPITFQILDQNDNWVTFHTIILSNTIQSPSINNPILPITAQVVKTGSTTTNLEIRTASWDAANVIPNEPSPAARYFALNSPLVTLNGAGLETHMLTIRNKTTFQSKPNKIRVTIEFVSAGTTNVDTLTSVLRLRKNATVTGLAFTDVNTAISVTEFSTAGTYTAGTGTAVLIIPNNTFGSGPVNILTFEGNVIVYINPGETLTITGQSLSGGGNIAIASISWFEQF